MIRITCPGCGREIAIEVATIDKLRAELAEARAALEDARDVAQGQGMFDALLRGFGK